MDALEGSVEPAEQLDVGRTQVIVTGLENKLEPCGWKLEHWIRGTGFISLTRRTIVSQTFKNKSC